MPKTLVLAASALLIAVSLLLAGCSGATAAPTAPTYGAGYLVLMLKNAEKTLKVKGTIKDEKQLQAQLAKDGSPQDVLSQALKAAGGTLTVTPAGCYQAFTAASAAAQSAVSDKTIVEAVLEYPDHIIGLATSTTGSFKKATESPAIKALNDFAKQNHCETMTMAVKTAKETVSFVLKSKKVAITTRATTSVGVEEDMQLAGQTLLVESIVLAKADNLDVSVLDITKGSAPKTSELEKAVNAVLDGAKS